MTARCEGSRTGRDLLREDFVGDTFDDFDEQGGFGQAGGADDGSARRVGDELTVDTVEERPLPHICEEDHEGDDAFIAGLGSFKAGLDVLEGGPILGFLVVAYDDAVEPGGGGSATEDLDGPDLQHAKEIFLEIVAVEPDAVGNCIRGLMPSVSDDEVQETVPFIEGEGVGVGDGNGVEVGESVFHGQEPSFQRRKVVVGLPETVPDVARMVIVGELGGKPGREP